MIGVSDGCLIYVCIGRPGWEFRAEEEVRKGKCSGNDTAYVFFKSLFCYLWSINLQLSEIPFINSLRKFNIINLPASFMITFIKMEPVISNH